IVIMASGAEAAQEAVDALNAQGEKVGVLKVRMYRPFDVDRFVAAFPATTKSIAVLDRTKEPGATGEPMYLDTITALFEGWPHGALPMVTGGRYGLSSKEFTPAMVKGVFDNMLADQPKNHFTVGIIDDVTNTSLDYDPEFDVESDSVVRALFYGLGSDGTVGANKNSIKIIGENTNNYAQGHFVYDSKKSGSMTVSHLRFGPQPIHSPYQITRANFIACHQTVFLEKYDVLKDAVKNGIFLLNSTASPETVWDTLPEKYQRHIINKNLAFYVIDAYKVARDSGMRNRINTIMQTCFFAISGVLPRDEAIEEINKSIKKTYGKKGEEIVKMNLVAVDNTIENLHKVTV
ncbi:MAG: 2-oxoacid:acceptor oxidoreductase family protein, partial [Anaerolineae bacterium]|nr:2-oxoacid:acceptor oxidoreductase family protein [Anaerolineae bacterium]